jgi:hypothetical protein
MEVLTYLGTVRTSKACTAHDCNSAEQILGSLWGQRKWLVLS